MATADTILNRVEEHVTPMGALAVAVVAVSTSAILVRWSTAPSSVVAFYRVLLTTVLLAPVGARMAHAFPAKRLSVLFGLFLVAASLRLFYRAFAS